MKLFTLLIKFQESEYYLVLQVCTPLFKEEDICAVDVIYIA